jgi:regulator of Ty1 transposition protein 103
VEKKLEEIDRTRGSRKPGLGGSLFSSGPEVPAELQSLVDTHTALQQADEKAKTGLAKVKAAEPTLEQQLADNVSPQACVATITSVLQDLNDVTGSISSALTSRRTLVESLQKLIDDNKSILAREEATLDDLEAKMSDLTAKKKTIENTIIQNIINNGEDEDYEPPRPDAEPLTPPEAAGGTPPDSPKPLNPSVSNPLAIPGLPIGQTAPLTHQLDASGAAEQPAKRRKLDQRDELAEFAGNDFVSELDPEVAALLG